MIFAFLLSIEGGVVGFRWEEGVEMLEIVRGRWRRVEWLDLWKGGRGGGWSFRF
jgi:hypothetical protein